MQRIKYLELHTARDEIMIKFVASALGVATTASWMGTRTSDLDKMRVLDYYSTRGTAVQVGDREETQTSNFKFLATFTSRYINTYLKQYYSIKAVLVMIEH